MICNSDAHYLEQIGEICSVFNLEDEAPSLWTLQEPNKTKNFGLSGWNRGKGIATEVCIQPWSNIEGMGRWLAFCKS